MGSMALTPLVGSSRAYALAVVAATAAMRDWNRLSFMVVPFVDEMIYFFMMPPKELKIKHIRGPF